jgi:hypothetical protein
MPLGAYAAPAIPTNLTVSNASAASTPTDQSIANVSWTAVTGAIFYRITAVAGIDTIVEQVPSNQTTYVFPSTQLAQSTKGLTGGTTYSFTIKSVDKDGVESAASTAVNFVAQSVPATPTVEYHHYFQHNAVA